MDNNLEFGKKMYKLTVIKVGKMFTYNKIK